VSAYVNIPSEVAEESIESVKEQAKKFEEQLKTKVNNAAKTARTTAHYVEDSVESLTDNLRQNVNTAKGKLNILKVLFEFDLIVSLESAKETAEDLKESVSEKARTISERVAAGKDNIKDSIQHAAEDVKNMAENMKDAAKDRAAGIKAGIESSLGLDAERAENERVQRRPAYIQTHWNLLPTDELLLENMRVRQNLDIDSSSEDIVARLVALNARDSSLFNSAEQSLISRLNRELHGSARKPLVEKFDEAIGLSNNAEPAIQEKYTQPIRGEDIAGFEKSKEAQKHR